MSHMFSDFFVQAYSSTYFAWVPFLAASSLYWGLAPHKAHCDLVTGLVKKIGMHPFCPPHYIHLAMGLAFYLSAVFINQRNYFMSS